MDNQPLVYIAGPITLGDTMLNTRHALGIAEILIERGFAVFVPQLSIFWHFLHPHDHDWWLRTDYPVLLKCDCLFRLPGKSTGADMEVAFAMQHNIPVFYCVEKLQAWRRSRESQ